MLLLHCSFVDPEKPTVALKTDRTFPFGPTTQPPPLADLFSSAASQTLLIEATAAISCFTF